MKMQILSAGCLTVLTFGTLAIAAETAVPMAEFGVEKVMTGPVTPPPATDSQYKGVVKIEMDSLTPDYATPWNPGRYQSGIGTGFLIGPNQFMTNAHVVSNAERIYISMYGDSRKIPARVKFIAHDADLALLEAADFTPFKDVTPFEFSDGLPRLEDEVRVIGYPIGGNRLSVTRGVVSRLDFTTYAHPRDKEHLTIQVDAAINPGNSGGPALMDDKVIGVAFQGLNNANNTGYVIPTPVIRHFLKDIKDGVYDGYVDMGFAVTMILNPAMRKAFKLPNDEKGVLVGKVFKGASADGVLQTGDILMKINGYSVDSSAMVELDGQKISMKELIERCFKNEKLPLEIIRKGQTMTVNMVMKKSPAQDLLTAEYDKMPRYVVFGGLVLQPMQRNVLAASQIPTGEIMLEIEHFREDGGCVENEDIVIITNILDDEVNARLSAVADGAIIEEINGVKVKGLTHAHELLYPEKMPEYIVIKLKGENRPLVFEGSAMAEANKRIAKTYNIMKNARLSSDIPGRQQATPVHSAH